MTPHTVAELHIKADLARLLLLVSTCVGAPVTIARWECDATGLPVPVFFVPIDSAMRAYELGLRVEVE
jgi:hypothetical protein